MTHFFLSHTSSDKPFVRQVAAHIRHLGATPWVDENELSPGDSLLARISTALESSAVILAFVSEKSVESRWVQKELLIAMTQEMQSGSIRVLPLRIDSCKLPAFLIDKLYIDFVPGFRQGIVRLCNHLFPDRCPHAIDIVVRPPSDEPIFTSLFELTEGTSTANVEEIRIDPDTHKLCVDLRVPPRLLGLYRRSVLKEYSTQPDADFPDQIGSVGFQGTFGWIEVYFDLSIELELLRKDIELVVDIHNAEISRCEAFFLRT